MPFSFGSHENVVDWFHAGIIVQYTQRDNRDLTTGVNPRHFGAAYIAKYLREVLRLRQLVTFEMVFTDNKLDAAHRCKTVGRMSCRPRTPASGTVTVVDRLERLCHVKLDSATHATAAHHTPGPVTRGLFLDARVSGLGRIIVMAWQVSGNLKPRCTVAYEYIAVRFPTLVVATARSNDVIPDFAGVWHD